MIPAGDSGDLEWFKWRCGKWSNIGCILQEDEKGVVFVVLCFWGSGWKSGVLPRLRAELLKAVVK